MINCSRHADLCVCLFSRAIISEVPPPKVKKLQHFITIFSFTIAGIFLLSCIYVVGHKQIPLCEYQTWISLNFFLWNFKIIFNAFKPKKFFLWNLYALKFMKSCTKSPITWKVLHLEHFVKICYSVTFCIATTWWVTLVSIPIAKWVMATFWLFSTFHCE